VILPVGIGRLADVRWTNGEMEKTRIDAINHSVVAGCRKSPLTTTDRIVLSGNVRAQPDELPDSPLQIYSPVLELSLMDQHVRCAPTGQGVAGPRRHPFAAKFIGIWLCLDARRQELRFSGLEARMTARCPNPSSRSGLSGNRPDGPGSGFFRNTGQEPVGLGRSRRDKLGWYRSGRLEDRVFAIGGDGELALPSRATSACSVQVRLR